MPALLAEVTRGSIVESRHYGHVAVCDSKGNLIAKAGDPKTVTYIRSACKPIQALNVFVSGAQDKYNFSSEELAALEPFRNPPVINDLGWEVGVTRSVVELEYI